MQTRTGRLQQRMVLQQEAVNSIPNTCCTRHPEPQPAVSLSHQPAPVRRSVGLWVCCLVEWSLGCKSKHILVMINELNQRRKNINLISREKLKRWCHLKAVGVASPFPTTVTWHPLCSSDNMVQKKTPGSS